MSNMRPARWVLANAGKEEEKEEAYAAMDCWMTRESLSLRVSSTRVDGASRVTEARGYLLVICVALIYSNEELLDATGQQVMTQKGVAEDCSYGLYAAESAGFPQEVVDDARRIRVVLAANKDTVSRCVLTNFHAHRGHHPSTLNPILVAGNEKQLVACMQTLKVSFSARLCTQARAQRHVLAPVQNNLEPEAY